MNDRSLPEVDQINIYRESSLHLGLKRWYASLDDRLEVAVDGAIIDIVRGSQLIEIQTGNFSAIRKKLQLLLENHTVRLVHPIPATRWIVKQDQEGRVLSRRRSPKRGTLVHVFSQLVYLHDLIHYANFSMEVLMIEDEELRINDGKGSWRRKGWSISDRILVDVLSREHFETSADFAALLPAELPAWFTTADLARGLGQRRRVAQQMAYCLREMGLIEPVGKQGRAYLYSRRT